MPAPHHNGALPATPAKPHRRTSSVQNSPFSDYFTDDARSVDSNVPSTETKHLLVRMNKLQSQLMRDSSSDAGRNALRIVSAKLDEIEREFAVLHAQINAPSFAVEDSGIFSDEEEADTKHAHPEGRRSEPYLDTVNGSMELPPEPTTIAEFRAERDWFILRTQELLDGLRFTQSELSKRFTEVRLLNEEHNAQIEERDTQIEQLRSENEGLRSDLGFEYSELLFLKLQMKSLEVDMDAINEDVDISGTAISKEKAAKKNRILSEMDRWRSDWQDVKGRFKRRRSRYGVSPDRRDSLSVDGEASPATGEAEWHLQTVKEGHGRVTSLTIKRMDSSYGASIEETSGTADTADPLNIDIGDSATLGATDYQASDQKPDLEGHQITTQGTASEPQIAASSTQQQTHIYVEHGTQTEYQPLISQDEEVEDEDDDENRLFPFDHQQNEPDAEEGDEEEEEDCAITTSSEPSDVEDEEEVETPKPTKTAWQELWESLQNLTGIDDRFED